MSHGLFYLVSIRVIEKLSSVLRVTGAVKEQNGYHPGNLTLLMSIIAQRGANRDRIHKVIEKNIDHTGRSWYYVLSNQRE